MANQPTNHERCRKSTCGLAAYWKGWLKDSSTESGWVKGGVGKVNVRIIKSINELQPDKWLWTRLATPSMPSIEREPRRVVKVNTEAGGRPRMMINPFKRISLG